MNGEKLYTDRDYFNRMFGSIDQQFEEVNEKLDKLNGTILGHEKIINENLPHNISHCSQVDNIKILQDNMITTKAVKKTIYTSIVLLGIVISVIWGIVEIFLKKG